MSRAEILEPLDEAARRRRVRRTALVLALIALAFYVGFIVQSVMRNAP